MSKEPLNVARLVSALEEMGQLMELDGADSFRSGSYPRAARAIAEHADVFHALLREGRLKEIPGVGDAIAKKIADFAENGTFRQLEELRAKLPAGLRQMVAIPGFGPKKARAVWNDLGIAGVDELEAACRDGRVAGLKGFGEKTAAKILAGIEQLRTYSGRHRLDVALAAAEPIRAMLEALPAVRRMSVAGSLRRWRETVKDLDFVVDTANAPAVMDAFVAMPGVTAVNGKGGTKASVILDGNLQADLRCVSEAEYPFTLLHFTGSKEHNTRLRQRAKDRGMKLNEYGLFPEGTETSVAATSEADVYAALGLMPIPPELREDMGEVEAAEAGTIPELITRQDLRGVVHLHTTYSDGKPSLRDYAEWAAANAIEWMGISDHSRSLAVARGMPIERVLEQHAEIDAINAEFAPRGVRLLKGIESDILADGSLDYPDEILAQFDFIIASVHTLFTLPEEEQTARMLRAIVNPRTTILGHMTGRLLLAREPYKVDQRALIRAAAQHRVAIEINANPWRLDLDWRLVHYAIEQGAKLAISPDAHSMEGLADISFGVAMARKGWATKGDVVNCLGAEELKSRRW